MGAIRKFLAVSPREKHTIVAAACAVGLVRAGLWLLPFSSLVQLVERLSRPARLGAHRDSQTEEVANAVRRVASYVPAATCLTQALALSLLLSRRGETSRIKIGIARDADGGLKSHAWVEQDGRVLIGDNGELSSYATMVSLDRAGGLLG